MSGSRSGIIVPRVRLRIVSRREAKLDVALTTRGGARIDVRRFKMSGGDLHPHSAMVTRSGSRGSIRGHDRYLYARLERRTGAIVFSSSLGDEVSLESPALGNGVFTAALLRVLGTKQADTNGDGWISIDELEPAVKAAVVGATGNLQHPTIDRENPLVDFRLPVLR